MAREATGVRVPRAIIGGPSQEEPVTINRIDPGRRFAEAVVYGDTVFLAGHVGWDPSDGDYEQTRDILAQIDGHLAAAGTDKSSCSWSTCGSPTSPRGREMNRAWDEWVDRANLPARATVEARLASPDYKVEIAGIAARTARAYLK